MSRTKKGLLNLIINWVTILKRVKDIKFKYISWVGINPIKNKVQTSLFLFDRDYTKMATPAEAKKFIERFTAEDEMKRTYLLKINPDTKDWTIDLRDQDWHLLAKYGTAKILISYKAR